MWKRENQSLVFLEIGSHYVISNTTNRGSPKWSSHWSSWGCPGFCGGKPVWFRLDITGLFQFPFPSSPIFVLFCFYLLARVGQKNLNKYRKAQSFWSQGSVGLSLSSAALTCQCQEGKRVVQSVSRFNSQLTRIFDKWIPLILIT